MLIYLGVAITVISTGLVTLAAPLSHAVTSFAVVTAAIALATAAWHIPWGARRRWPARLLRHIRGA
jgi:hypothetical protein